MNILDYLRNKCIEPKQVTAAGEHASPCPACGGEDRFVIPADTGRWFCRRCSPKGGDIIDLIKLVEGVDFKTARDMSGKITQAPASVSTFYRHLSPPARQALKRIEPPPAAWQNAAADFIERSHQALLKHERALSWLKSARRIELETVKRFKLGLNENSTYEPWQKWGLPEQIDQKTGRPKMMWIPDGLVIPRHDATGGLIQVKIRRKPLSPPFVFLPGSSEAQAFYGQVGQTFVVVESELDAILIWQEAGDLITPVSTGGVSMKPDEASVKTMAAGELVLISFDSDEAGRAPGRLSTWRSALPDCCVLPIPTRYGKDHTDACLSGMNLRAWVMAGLNLPTKTIATKITASELQPRDGVENRPGVFEPVRQETNVIAGTESQTSKHQPDAAERELILKAITLADRTWGVYRTEISRALDKLDACRANDRPFVLSILAAKIEDAESVLLR